MTFLDRFARGGWKERDGFTRLLLETDGQDTIEYALLTTFIGFAGAAAWEAMRTGLGVAYGGFTTGVWNLWEPANPVGGGS